LSSPYGTAQHQSPTIAPTPSLGRNSRDVDGAQGSDPNSFSCVSNPDFTSDVTTRKFSRYEFKECIYAAEGGLEGTSNKRIMAKRPDGTEQQVG
jgi:hypothetical protein